MAESTNDTTPIFWKREITMGQALSIVIPIITLFMLSFWDMKSDLIKHDMRLTSLEKSQENLIKVLGERDHKTDQQYDTTNEKLQQILIRLENKKDR